MAALMGGDAPSVDEERRRLDEVLVGDDPLSLLTPHERELRQVLGVA